MDLLNDKEIMQEYVLSKIIRYNNKTRLQDESVAEHICFVSIFCLKIMSGLDLDLETERKVLIAAALHDAPESITSDIPHNVKKMFPEIDDILKNIENDYYEINWKKYKSIIDDKDYLVWCILKLADTYSVYQYCLNEKKLGNLSNDNDDIFEASKIRLKEYIEKINKVLAERGKTL